MRFARFAYCVAVVMIGGGSLSAGALSEDVGLPAMIILQSSIAVLTYPSGFIASLVSAALVLTGTTTLLEAIVLTTPLFAALGYLQWFWLFPKIYGADHNKQAVSEISQTPHG